MEIPQPAQDRLQPLDRGRFRKIKDDEFRPPYELVGLKYLRDKAGNERNLRELYRGRAPYELLQNADDAKAKRALFILSDEGFAFVHDGLWFTVDNFRCLADGWSDKDPNQCIGHKGLGFRSVLDITPSPYLVKIHPKEFFAIKFTWALNNGHIQEALKRNASLRQHYEQWTASGRQCCPVMAIPGEAKKQNLGASSVIYDNLIQGRYGPGFTTMFWFPVMDPDIPTAMLSELSPLPIRADKEGRERLLQFLDKELRVLMPFLRALEECRVHESGILLGQAKTLRKPLESNCWETIVSIERDRTLRTESFVHARFVSDIPDRVRNLPDTPKAVRMMRSAGITLSVRIQDGQPVPENRALFHVYFPTEESTGTGFVIQGDFFVKPDRTRLML